MRKPAHRRLPVYGVSTGFQYFFLATALMFPLKQGYIDYRDQMRLGLVVVYNVGTQKHSRSEVYSSKIRKVKIYPSGK